MKRKLINNYHELQILKIRDGVMLVEPSKLSSELGSPQVQNTGTLIADFMNMPVSFWLLGINNETKLINREGADICGFQSEHHAIGKSLEAVSEKASAIKLIENCDQVIQGRNLHIFDECNVRKDGVQQQFLSIKMPWYDKEQQIAGVFGISIVMGRHSLASNLSELTRMGLLGNTPLQPVKIETKADKICQQLSIPPREKQCLHFMLRGYTAKMIARQLGLSFRTVESYINNLKDRLGVSSRLELIQLVMC